MSKDGLQKLHDPAGCATREDIRHEIDRLDSNLVALLSERWQYVHRMSELKTDVSEANVPSRVNQVVANVVQQAKEAGLPPQLAENLWRDMVDFAIKYEESQIRARDSD